MGSAQTKTAQMESAQTKTALPTCQSVDQKVPMVKVEDEGSTTMKLKTERHNFSREAQMTISMKVTQPIPFELTENDIEDLKSKFSRMQGLLSTKVEELSLENDSNSVSLNITLESSQNNENRFVLDMKNTDTIRDVKTKIQDKEGVPTSQQIIFYNGKELDDDSKTLSAQNCSDCCNLHVIFRKEDDTLQINVVIDKDGAIITCNLKRWYTVRQLKIIIESEVGVNWNFQSLYIDNKKNQLDDDMTLADYRIMQEQTLHMKYSGLQIFVEGVPGKTILRVRLSDTVGALKAMLTNGAPARQAAIVFQGKYLCDDDTVRQSGIREQSTIHFNYRAL